MRSLVECATGAEPCGLPFCALCVRDLRRHYQRLAEQGLTAGVMQQNHQVNRFSARPAKNSHTIAIGQLHTLRLDEVRAATLRDLNSLQFPLVFAWLALALEKDRKNRWVPFWQIRVEGAVLGRSPVEVEQALLPLCPSDSFTPRPVAAASFDDFPGAVSDCVRPRFAKYVRNRKDADRGQIEVYSLRRHHQHELARFLARYDIADRVLFVDNGAIRTPAGYCPPKNKHKYDWQPYRWPGRP
jgi:hypothetical protein